ncbi:MAG: uracil-DNA glycosylase, partial [Alphaproteobacteria bacterium]|nr:uracil-DNA glycosylase [Alphaproteobacteria bacterium]
ANCDLCPPLAAIPHENALQYPDFFNAPVPAFGALDARLLIAGLAPGLKGANATGRPFTGDYAGDVLYEILKSQGLASGSYEKHAQDSLQLHDCRITNAVRCVPPQNKPETSEIHTCNHFLRNELAAMPNLQVIFSLGGISHKAVLSACGHKASFAKFAHGVTHKLTPDFRAQPLWLVNTYHSSRYNINTGRVTLEMIEDVVVQAKKLLE